MNREISTNNSKNHARKQKKNKRKLANKISHGLKTSIENSATFMHLRLFKSIRNFIGIFTLGIKPLPKNQGK